MISIRLAACGMFFTAVAAAAGPLVIRASGPSAAAFKAGQRIAGDGPVMLKAGDQLVVLDARGTRSLAGPGSFRFDAAATAGSPQGITSLLTQTGERRARIGAVRGFTLDPATRPVPPGIWAIDVGNSATVCALDPARVSLWRADTAAAAAVPVTRGDGKTGTAEFAGGQSVAPWPSGAAINGGGRYTVGTGPKATTLLVKLIRPAPATIEELAAAFIANGCQSQLDRMVRVTAAK